MTTNPLLDSNTTDGFVKMSKLLMPNSVGAADIYDVRFWCDYAIAPSHHFPFNFCQRQKQLVNTFKIMRVFRKSPEQYVDVREFCTLAQGVYDVLNEIKK